MRERGWLCGVAWLERWFVNRKRCSTAIGVILVGAVDVSNQLMATLQVDDHLLS